MSGRGGRRRGGKGGNRQYPRSVRVNEILREVLAESLERMITLDERLGLLTITGVSCDPDLRRATVWLASLSDDEAEALGELRIRLQAEISRQVRLKRTPQLSFQADPAIASGIRVEAILRELDLAEDEADPLPGQSASDEPLPQHPPPQRPPPQRPPPQRPQPQRPQPQRPQPQRPQPQRPQPQRPPPPSPGP